MQDRDRRLLDLASRQYNLFSAQQAHQFGFPPSTIRERLRTGRWKVAGSGVYTLPVMSPEREQRLMAAVLGLKDAVVSHEAAAWLHQLEYVGSTRLSVTVPVRSTHRFHDVAVHESTDLTNQFRMVLRDLPVTTLERTVFDLASCLSAARLKRVVEDVLARRLTRWERLVDTQAQLGRRGKRGVVRLGEVLASMGPGYVAPMSELEATFLRLVESAGIEAPTRQFHLPWRDTPDGHVDFAWIEQRLIIEVDGRRWHARDQAWGEDVRREAEASIRGWQLQRFTFEQVKSEVEFVIAVLRQRLRLRLERMEPGTSG